MKRTYRAETTDGLVAVRKSEKDYPFACIRHRRDGKPGGIGTFHQTREAAEREARKYNGGEVVATEVVG
jgi:hypothetical protein